jgi:hypothetical protein
MSEVGEAGALLSVVSSESSFETAIQALAVAFEERPSGAAVTLRKLLQVC